VATASAASIPSSIPHVYRPRGRDPLRRLFRQRFPAFRLCGDWSQCIARIRCPDCGYEGLLNREFARTLLSWKHSGFSIDSGTRIYDTQARQGLCQYIIRAPLAMQKLEWDEEQDTVPRAGNCTATWKSSPTGYFQGKHLLRRYG
jgi:hypothetical protein